MTGQGAKPVPVLLMVRELGIGGTERQLVETARFLDRQRFVPHVGCFRPGGLRRAELEQAGVPILHLPVYSFKSPAVFTGASQLVRYIRQHRIQIVHTFDAPLNVFAVPVARFAGAPAVISSQRGDRDLTTQGLKRLLRITDRMVDAVVANCEYMRQYLVKEEGVAPGKVRLCYNGIDTEQYTRRIVDSPFPGKIAIGTVCALRPEKGVDILIRAFAALNHPNAALIIVGGGPEEAKLRKLCAEVGVRDCHFEPATQEVARWLSAIDVFVLPSRSEALSNALMEAMACACCCVATRVGGNPELIEEESTGLLFPVNAVEELAGKLRGLLGDELRRRRLAAAASARIATSFTFAHAAHSMQEIYESVLSAKRKASKRSLASSA
jgi:L-malate glycosyltransferase